jgi:uncharacterized protein YuzE
VREMLKPITYDRQADAVYVYLSDRPYAYGRDLDDDRRIDYAADGTVRGVEFLGVSYGVDLSNIPQADYIAMLLRDYGIRLLAS